MAQVKVKKGTRVGRCERTVQLARELCMAPLTDYPVEEEGEAAEFRRDLWRLRRALDTALTEDLRRELVEFIQRVDDHRDTYMKILRSWIDLIEELTLAAEMEYGDGTGPLKMQYVEDAAQYVLIEMTKDIQFDIPSVPLLFEPLARRIMIVATVEFVITLVNNDKEPDMALWKNQPLPGKKAAVPMLRPLSRIQSLRERVGRWLVRVLFREPKLAPVVKQRVDEILADLARDGFSIEHTTRQLTAIVNFVGNHAREFRSLVQALSVIIKIAADFTEGTREERLEWIREAAVLYMEDLGFSGPYFRAVTRAMVNILVEPMLHLYERRDVIAI